jgi:hypothetical protein
LCLLSRLYLIGARTLIECHEYGKGTRSGLLGSQIDFLIFLVSRYWEGIVIGLALDQGEVNQLVPEVGSAIKDFNFE